MTMFNVIVAFEAENEAVAKDIVERGLDKQGIAMADIGILRDKHPEHKLGGIVEAAIDKAMDDNDWIAAMASDPNIKQNTTDEVFQALESYVCDELALTIHN